VTPLATSASGRDTGFSSPNCGILLRKINKKHSQNINLSHCVWWGHYAAFGIADRECPSRPHGGNRSSSRASKAFSRDLL